MNNMKKICIFEQCLTMRNSFKEVFKNFQLMQKTNLKIELYE